MKALFILFAGLLAAQGSRAQLFVWYAKEGVELLAPPAKPVPLRADTWLKEGQSLRLKPGAQVILYDRTGHNIAYDKAGQVSYHRLQQALATSTAGLSNAFLAYVGQSLLHHETPPAKQGNAPRAGVRRGGAFALVQPLDSAVLEQPRIVFQWRASEPVWFTVTDSLGNPLLQLRTSADSLELNSQLSRLSYDTRYYWTVTASADPANEPRQVFLLASPARLEQVARLLAGVPIAPANQEWQHKFQKYWFFSRYQPDK